MDNGQGWYRHPQQTSPYYYPHQQQVSPNGHGPPHHVTAPAAVDSVHDAQRLLAVYPPASATPTAHVARHLSNMTLTAAPPSFMQPNYYSMQHAGHYVQDGNPPPYTEYAQEMSYISAPQVPANDGGYWENTRNDAVRLLGDHSHSPYAHHTSTYNSPLPWMHHSIQSSYHPTPFAQSIIQRSVPSSAYPTPPPPSIPSSSPSSSSLAYALGVPEPPPPPRRQPLQLFFEHESRPKLPPPVAYSVSPSASHPIPQTSHPVPSASYPIPPPASRPIPPPASHPVPSASRAILPPASHSVPPPSQQQQPPQIYRPEESGAFFNNFLEQKSRQIKEAVSRNVAEQPQPQPVASTSAPPSSPDPLRLASSNNNSPAAITPQKRKAETDIESPSIKRIQVLKLNRVDSPRTTTPKKGGQLQASPLKQISTIPTTPTSKFNRTGPNVVTPTGRTPVTPSSGQKRLFMAYVSVPPPPAWLTPTSSRKGGQTPTKSGKTRQMNLDDTPDFGGYGMDEDESPTRPRANHGSMVKSSSRRTGDRDERAPLEKLVSLIEDIFEAEDSLPAEISDPADLPSEFFSHFSTDLSRPLLAPSVIRKLINYIGHVARPTKRDVRNAAAVGHGQMGSGALNTPRHKGRMGEVETQVLSRLLKMLERNVRGGEDLDPFLVSQATVTRDSVTASPRKNRKGAAKKVEQRAKSQTPKEGGEDGTVEGHGVDCEGHSNQGNVKEVDHEQLTKTLDMARDSVFAADCCIALLASDRLAKQLYAEELITACLATLKNQLTKIIYPFVEATSSAPTSMAPSLRQIVKDTSVHSQSYRRQLSETFQALSSVLPRVNGLINAESIAMSDTIIIQVVYIAIGPFFVVESGEGGAGSGGGDGDGEKERGKKKGGERENAVIRTFGKSAMRGLRLDALSLIRTIFANHEEQRSWIIEEILSSLIKLSDTKQKAGQFRLRDGRSIRTVSALLLQLVQTSAHDVRIEARRIGKARQNAIALRRQESFSESQSQGRRVQEKDFLDEHDREEIRLYGSGLESATKAAKTIVLFLTQRSGKGKAVKNTNEAEYRTIFDNLISDLLVVLYWPEWPAASLLLSIACKYMVSSLDDIKSSSQSESSNAAKTIALDHLGVVAARIRSSMLKVQQYRPVSQSKEGSRDTSKSKSSSLKPLDEIVSNVDVNSLERLLASHRELAAHLCKRSSEDQAYDSARELTAATFGQELASALKQVNNWISDSEHDDDLNIKDQSKLAELGERLKLALREVWKDPGTDLFDINSQEEVVRVDRLAEEIGTNSILRSSFHPILTIILMALDAPHIFMRTKALRALGQIVTSDATILSTANVRHAIESHLIDSSPAVRDAAVELIGKYMVDSPEVAGDYYNKIADRIADTGLSVRKRVIKLLKAFYAVTEDNQKRIDIATRLVLRMLDEDDTVKELAMRTVEELWFPSASTTNQASAKSRTYAPSGASHDKSQLQSKVSVIMGTAANFKDRQSPLESLLHKIMAEKEGTEAAALHARYAEICETLIDGLVDATDLPGFTVVNCIRTIYLFSSAYPPILSGSNASTLLPYLKNASTTEELATSDYLLKIFRVSIPHMPKTAAKFGHELQSALQPMVVKPSSGGTHVLQEAVACLCIVIQHLTHDFVRVVNLVKSCNGRLQQAVKRSASQTTGANDTRALLLVTFISSLLVEHCDFDRLRNENESLAPEIDSISQGSIVEHTYDTLIHLYENYDSSSLRARILQCLGFLFRAQPTLMTKDRSSAIMDAIFASPDQEGHGRLLKIIQDFLMSEAEKHTMKEKENAKNKSKTTEVNMDELVGNTDGFADSGVSSAVVQRYLNPILDAALAKHVQIQAVAIDVLTFTIKQGLAHPLQSFPVIIALETSPVPSISNRASALHAILHGKHASLLNTRYTTSARASFDYQKKIRSDVVQGFRMHPVPTALLQRWYSLVREKRPTRQDFLKSLVKVFQENPSYQSSQDDVEFTRYMAENFATLEYKTQEEVLTVIKHLTTVLSTTGMQILEHISPSHLLAQLQSPTKPSSDNATVDNSTDGPSVPSHVPPASVLDEGKIPLMRTSVIIGMAMLLKAHLKTLYSLSEDKCVKFVVGKKSAIGDKPAIKRHDNPITWERLPYATAPILTSLDVDAQETRFLDIWNEDGVSGEPEDDLEM
ncbi:hypothetical protein AX17_003730 [Amanita inopinata Kibby_2008]|nr:hypothetical protein AX17_003730 [Amanita inopinata Kibby_2008]